jgi:hypothetical protein
MKGKDLSGCVFGRLTVLGLLGYSEKGMSVWECRCSCGTVKPLLRGRLINDKTQSCGCLHREKLRSRNSTHGATGSPTYKKWRGMWSRVKSSNRAKNACYKNISVHPAWDKYENFARDMGECPVGHSLDRIDSTKGYVPANCRWVPLARQAANTSRNVVIELNGVTATISDHSRTKGLPPDVVFDRINKLRWSVDEALNTPLLRAGQKRPKNK